VTYRLSKLAAGSYDIILNGVIIASLVRTTTGRHDTKWTAELLIDLPPGERPAPFVEAEHEFPTLEAACSWLGVPEGEMRNAANGRLGN
jgi:hypothetical protein